MSKGQHKSEGSFLIAEDLADRLLPNLPMSELLLWPPDLFSFTSYVLGVTGAYQLVISPPTNEKWPPKNDYLGAWLTAEIAKENVTAWFNELFAKSKLWGLTFTDKAYFESYLLSEFENGLNLNVDVKSGLEADKGQVLSQVSLSELLTKNDRSYWKEIVVAAGKQWREKISTLSKPDFDLIDEFVVENQQIRNPKVFRIILDRTPPIVLAFWSHFYKKTVIEPNDKIENENVPPGRKRMPIEALLCNESDNRFDYDIADLWPTAQTLISMHAICDEACVNWGIKCISRDEQEKNSDLNAEFFAQEYLLRGRGTLSTVNTERCRVLPKRHNPNLGITLRSLSSNLAFHRSSVEVVWRNSATNDLTEKLKFSPNDHNSSAGQSKKTSDNPTISMLLLPLPIQTRTKDFRVNRDIDRVDMDDDYGFFSYKPGPNVTPQRVIDLIEKASENLEFDESRDRSIDIVVLPESAMRASDVTKERSNTESNKEECLEGLLEGLREKIPSIYVIGVREEVMEKSFADQSGGLKRFPRNAVYCKYFDKNNTEKYGTVRKFRTKQESDEAPKYVQYKHHRWLLDANQIKQYGLSQVLNTRKNWWEAIKVPRRRVSFLNIGQKMTLCHLICEDLARQDPIADLIRQVGPSLVITILLDGPQRTDRWASRYATVLSEDPGCSVITLTSFGMVSRWSSPYRSMSRVIALWSDKDTFCREIELAQGAEAVLLTIEVDTEREVTADGRKESEKHVTSVLKLKDVIQVYPK